MLFFDDRFVDSQEGLMRTMHTPDKWGDGPMFRPEMPWEGKCVIIWGSVLWDPQDDLFKMWYQTHNPIAPLPNRTLLCYATSRDGVHWDRPNLGLHEYEGSGDNNIVYRPTDRFDSATVVIDPFDPPANARFKMIHFDTGRHCHMRFQSSDGLRWQELGPVEGLGKAGDRHSLTFDTQRGRWLLYFKKQELPRAIHLATSEDFEHWTNHGEVLAANSDDPPEAELYGMVGFHDHGWGIGFLEVFKVLERRLNTQLVLLDDDGKPGRYRPGEVFLDHGSWGQWDAAWAFVGNAAPVRFGEELRFYYQGRPTLHWADPPNGTGHFGAIGMARLRVDGYVSLDGTGTLTTPPVEVTGRFLCINADASAGEVRVELLDDSGRQLGEYTAESNTPLACDATYYKQAWNGQSDLFDLKGQKLRIRVKLNNAKLYSLWFCDKPDNGLPARTK